MFDQLGFGSAAVDTPLIADITHWFAQCAHTDPMGGHSASIDLPLRDNNNIGGSRARVTLPSVALPCPLRAGRSTPAAPNP